MIDEGNFFKCPSLLPTQFPVHPEFSPLYITPPNFVRVFSHITAQIVSQGTLSLSMYLDVRPIIQIRGKQRATA